ncbi:MAG: hypothetical protein Q7J48_11900 [Nocardioides sp.]|nr:hypothetical protein [Nocardioides sp.]
MRRLVRECSLSLFFGVIFVAALVGQAIAGWKQYNAEQFASGFGQMSLGQYLVSADFAVDVAENWQSEYLQFTLYILMTVWLLQKGSPESKELDRAGRESDQDQLVGRFAEAGSPAWAKVGGWPTRLFSSSLVLVMCGIFLVSWLVQSIAGWAAFNETRLEHLQDPIAWGAYLLNADFWSRTLQNWQSEFLAVGSMAVFSIFLRQRGSPESKPVGAPHSSTGVEG